MIIIVLNGKANSGKTTVIHNLVEYLSKNNGQFICQKDKNRFNRKPTNNNTVSNFTVPFLYKDVLIAITSYGDKIDKILKIYENYVDYAKVMICAAHITTEHQNQLDMFENMGHKVVRVRISHSKETPSESEIKKKYVDCVDELLEKLNNAIKNIQGGN